MPLTTTPKILVVDDDSDTRANLRDILELDHFQVEMAGTVSEVLARREWSGIEVVILDRRLPDGNAHDLLPQIKQLAPQASVIIVTGFADVESAVSALKQGAEDYILKPINSDQLRTRLGNILERKRTRQALEEAAQRALQSERLAAIGETMTGLAHESRNALQRS
jgi:DNA-binding NtrC family response regulator